MKEIIEKLLEESLKSCKELVSEQNIPPVQVSYPDPKFGDFTTNIAMLLPKILRQSPMKIAETIIANLPPCADLDHVEAVKPGFMNSTMKPSFWHQSLYRILTEGIQYKPVASKKVNLEFVSANPTGPLNVVNARAASLGDSLARIMRKVGYKVDTEFYVNDAGRQVMLLGNSIKARLAQLYGDNMELPEDGYGGDYIIEIAEALKQKLDKQCKTYMELSDQEYSDFGVEAIIEQQRTALENFGVIFDRWFHERSLYAGTVDKVLKILQEKGLLYEKDGALWLRTTQYGDDEDRVLKKSDGYPTYFLSDIAYHYDKFMRGYDLVIDIWGPDHHGHIKRMNAAIKALGFDPAKFEVLIAQLVTLKRGQETVKMSKRGGEFVTLDELVEEIGVDAARCFFLMRRFDSHLDFDLKLAVTQSSENPVYYLQYAHARICSVFEKAKKRGYEVPKPSLHKLASLDTIQELRLINQVNRFPEIVVEAALSFEPHRVTFYLHDLCSEFHNYYNHQRILVDDPMERGARLLLLSGFRQTLKEGLNLLGIKAPEKM